MSKLRVGSMRQVMNMIHTILREDETLMRLLYYNPRNSETGDLDPLDENLPNIVDGSEKYWDIVENHLIVGTKTTDIEEKKICRIYIYPHRRRQTFRNHLFVNQEVVVDVLIHEKYFADMRLEWINDRVIELLTFEKLDNVLGKVDYIQGNNRINAPRGYDKYENTFEYVIDKKPI